MEMKKKNHIISELVSVFEKANRKRNFILISTVALSIIVLFLLLSLAKGRIQADQMKEIRKNGTNATLILERATENQYQKMAELDYVKEIGAEKEFGTLYLGEKKIAICSVVNKKGFQKLYTPAYENIVGNYPQYLDEVMLSTGFLDRLGIDKPEIGMEIHLKIVRLDWMRSGAENIEKSFRLSGYYTDYVSDTEVFPTAYFSEELLEEQGVDFFPAHVAMQSDKIWMNRTQLETQFHRDIEVEKEQKIKVINEGASQTIRDIAGSIGIAVFGITLILLSMNLIVYNIFAISIGGDIKQYGMLKTIGTTPRQIRKLFSLQCIRIVVKGSILGMVIGNLIVIFLLPKLIERMYLAGLGNVKPAQLYTWEFLVLSIILTSLVVFLAFKGSIRSVMTLTPMECLKFEKAIMVPKSSCQSKKGATIIEMAWKNFARVKKKNVISISSLCLGIEVTLISIVLINGLDQTHKIEQKSDFEIGVTKEAVYTYIYQNNGKSLKDVQGHPLMSNEMISEVSKSIEIKIENMIKCNGNFGELDPESKSQFPFLNYDNNREIYTGLTVQVVSDEWIEDLNLYARKEGLNIDLDSFQNDSGFIVLHNQKIPEQQLAKTENDIGQNLKGGLFEDGMNFFELTCSGYLDITQEKFPKLNMPWDGKNLQYIIISEKTKDEMNANLVCYHIMFDVKEEDELESENIIQSILADANQNTELKNTYYMIAKSDILAEEQSYILATQIVMGFFSGILMIFAIIGYCNSMITELIGRRMEFVILRSIGITERQLRKMLICEGIFYCGSTAGLLLTLGSVILIVLGNIMQKQVSYFIFQYPIFPLLLFIMILLCASIFIPLALVNKGEESIAEYRRNAERLG